MLKLVTDERLERTEAESAILLEPSVALFRSVETLRVLERKTCSSGIRDVDISFHCVDGHCVNIN